MKTTILPKALSTLTTALLITIVAQVAYTPSAYAATTNIELYPSTKGTITGQGINCPGDCTEVYDEGAVIPFTFTPAAGYVFVGLANSSCPFGIPQTGTTNCNYTVPVSDAFISAGWGYSSYIVTSSPQGTGSGKVTGTGTYYYGNTATLTATPDAGSIFSGWQTSGNACYLGGGKGDSSINPSATCTFQLPYTGWQTFTAVPKFDKDPNAPATTNTSSSTGNSKPATATSAPATTTIKAPTTNSPVADSLGELNINGEKISINEQAKKEFTTEKPIVLAGKTIPNGVVTLYVFSEPKKYTATADANGNWSVEVAGLPSGSHHAEIEVTDPATNQTSKREKLLEFAVAGVSTTNSENTNVAAVAATESQKGLKPVVLIGGIVGGIILLISIIIGGLYIFKRELFNSLINRIKNLRSGARQSPPSTLPPAHLS